MHISSYVLILCRIYATENIPETKHKTKGVS